MSGLLLSLWLIVTPPGLPARAADAGDCPSPAEIQQAILYRTIISDYRTAERKDAVSAAARLTQRDIDQVMAVQQAKRSCLELPRYAPRELQAAAMLEADAAQAQMAAQAFDEMMRHIAIGRGFLVILDDRSSFTTRWYLAVARRLRLAGLVAPWARQFLETAREELPRSAPIFVESGIVAELTAAGAANLRLGGPSHMPTQAARTLLYQRTLADGIAWLRRAVALDNTTTVRLHLARMLWAANKTPEAVAILEGVISEAPRSRPSYVARLLLGGAREQRGQPDEALRLYDEGIDLLPDAQSAYFASSALLIKQGRGEEARRRLREAGTRTRSESDDPWWELLFDTREDVLHELDSLRNEVRR